MGRHASGAQTLDRLQLTGAWVTMTPGVRCPSALTVNFSAQAEVSGALGGIYNEQGTLTLGVGEAAGTARVTALTSTFRINDTTAQGTVTLAVAPVPPLQVSCDALTLRVDGTVRYEVLAPFAERGTLHLDITGTRRAVTYPYFGQVVLTFTATPATGR